MFKGAGFWRWDVPAIDAASNGVPTLRHERNSESSRLDGVQILRGVAATAVAWHHALETSLGIGYDTAPPAWLVLLGAAGVDVFFVISGFIMVFICAKRGDIGSAGSSRRFLANRALRIYPLYWVCCAIFLMAIGLGFLSEKILNPTDILGSLVLIPTDARIVGISWTLSYEMYFYLVFATCLMFRDLRTAVAAAACLMAGLVIAANLSPFDNAFIASPITIEFVFGMVVGLLFVGRTWLPGVSWRPMLLLAGSAGFIASSVIFYAGTTHSLPPAVRFVAWGVPSVLFLLAAIAQPRPSEKEPAHVPPHVHAGLVRRLAVFVGDASYAIYLFHPLVLLIYAKAFQVLPPLTVISQWVLVPLVTIGCVAAGGLAHLYVEKPLMRLFHHRRPASAAPA